MPVVIGRSHLPVAALVLAVAVLVVWRAPWSTAAREMPASPTASSVAMNCAPGQRAVVKQAVVGGELKVAIDCAESELAPVAMIPNRGAASLHPAAFVTDSDVVTAPRITRASAPAPAAVRRAADPKRSWKKTALVIGGSAGGGAGIGALIGGKKGALIGAAVGGGGATLYEVLKKN